MIDHVGRKARLALMPLQVCQVESDWRFELLAGGSFTVAVILAVLLFAYSSIDKASWDAAGAADWWRARATAPEREPLAVVRIERDGVGYRCSVKNVRPEWEAAVAAECQVLGGLLHMARAPR